MLYKMLKK